MHDSLQRIFERNMALSTNYTNVIQENVSIKKAIYIYYIKCTLKMNKTCFRGTACIRGVSDEGVQIE